MPVEFSSLNERVICNKQTLKLYLHYIHIAFNTRRSLTLPYIYIYICNKHQKIILSYHQSRLAINYIYIYAIWQYLCSPHTWWRWFNTSTHLLRESCVCVVCIIYAKVRRRDICICAYSCHTYKVNNVKSKLKLYAKPSTRAYTQQKSPDKIVLSSLTKQYKMHIKERVMLVYIYI